MSTSDENNPSPPTQPTRVGGVTVWTNTEPFASAPLLPENRRTPASPLGALTYLATAPDAVDPRDGILYTFFMDNSRPPVLRMIIHPSSIANSNIAPRALLPSADIQQQNQLIAPSPLAITPLRNVLCPAHANADSVLKLFAIDVNCELVQVLPIYKRLGVTVYRDSKICATSNIQNTWIHYQRPDDINTIWEYHIEANANKRVGFSARPGTNIAGIETMMSISENPGPAACCRYIVYTDEKNNVHFNYVDAPGSPAIEIVYTIRELRDNSPLALAAVIDILAVYFIKPDNYIWRVNRGLYGWGTPRRVGLGIGVPIKADPSSPLSATNDSHSDERMVLVTYVGIYNGVQRIVSFRDRVTSDNCCNHCPRE